MTALGESLIRAVREEAAAAPDFVYDDVGRGSCVYIADGHPSCIIGRALWEAGVIGPSFEFDEGNDLEFKRVAHALGLVLDPDELSWLVCAQMAQDAQDPWGEAVRYADACEPW